MKDIELKAVLMIVVIAIAGCASNPAWRVDRAVTSIDHSPDRELLAFANANEIELVDAGTGRYVRTLRALPPDTSEADQELFRHGVGDTMVFLDDARIASTGMGGLVTLWDVDSGIRLSVIGQPFGDEYASTIDYSAVTHRLVIGTNAGRILATTLEGHDPQPLTTVTDEVGYVWDLQFSRDGKYFASASLMPRKPLDGDTSTEPDDTWAGMQVDESSSDGTYDLILENPAPPNVVIWDAESHERVGELKGATSVQRMALVPGQAALLTVGSKVAVWEFLTREQSEEISDPSMVLQSIGIGTLVAVSVVGMSMGGIPGPSFGESLYYMAHLPVVPTADSIRHSCARAAAISPDGLSLVSTTRGPSHNVMAVIDRKENEVIEKWTADSSVCDMQFSPDGKYLVTATSRGVFMFDTTSWQKTDLREQ